MDPSLRKECEDYIALVNEAEDRRAAGKHDPPLLVLWQNRARDLAESVLADFGGD